MSRLEAVQEQIRIAWGARVQVEEVLADACGVGDIVQTVIARFLGRAWREVKMDDWLNTADVETVASVMKPQAFHYYLPSILIGSLQNTEYIDWGVRALLPHNQRRETGRKWWEEFRGLVDSTQREAIVEFLNTVSEYVGPQDMRLRSEVEGALAVWTNKTL